MAPPSYITKRETQGAGQILFGKGGLGYLARRGVDGGTSLALRSLEGVAGLAVSSPLELLSYLPDLIPEMGVALWHETNLACGPGRVRLKAMLKKENGTSEEAPEGTAAIDSLWRNNPQEAGDLQDCHAQMYQMQKFAGLALCEAVPGARMQGLQAVFPVNSLTVRFKRESDGTLALYQAQTANSTGTGQYSAGLGGYFVPLPMPRIFYTKLPALPDEPYGRVPMASALTIVLEILAFWRNLMLAFERVGLPKYDYSFSMAGAAAFARDQLEMSDKKEISDYVKKEFNDFANRMNSMDVDEAFVHDVDDKVNCVGSGEGWPDFVGLWKILRLRLVQAIKSLSVVVGIVDGDTETWSETQWLLFTSSLMLGIQKSLLPLVRASQLHLQLLGMPFIVEPEITPLPSVQRLADAKAAAQEILNEARKRDEGWQSQETSAMKITGSAPVAEPRSWTHPTPQKENPEKQDPVVSDDSEEE